MLTRTDFRLITDTLVDLAALDHSLASSCN